MALVDVKEYYKKLEEQYFEMLDDIKDLDEACKDGILSEEQVKQAKSNFEDIKENYLRTSYIMFLLAQPKRKSKIDKYLKSNKDLYEYLKGNREEDVYKENEDCLVRLRKYVKEMKGEINMSVEKYVKDLGVTKEGKKQGDKYVITLENSDDFARTYSILETCQDLDLDNSTSLLSSTASKITYISSDYELSLNANFISDAYSLVVREIKDEKEEE